MLGFFVGEVDLHFGEVDAAGGFDALELLFVSVQNLLVLQHDVPFLPALYHIVALLIESSFHLGQCFYLLLYLSLTLALSKFEDL